MTMTIDQKLVSQFYETVGNRLNGQLLDIVDGPWVHNFIVKPSDNTNLSTMVKLAHENNVIITFNSKQVNVQIPKEKRQIVLLGNLLKSKEFKNTKAALPMIMGVDTFGNIVINDLRKMPHLLVSGRTGSGKSVFLNCLLDSLKTKLSPTECKFVIIDPMGVDFNHWDGEKHLMCPVVRLDAYAAIQKLQDILHIMDERYQKLQDNKVKNVEEYRKKTSKKDMPYIVVAVDEMAELMYVGKKQIEKCVQEIAQKARAVGIHLILATQRPDKETLSKIIKANMPTLISFQARNSIDSMLMLGERGAERLLPCGDMFFSDAGRMPVRIHSAFVKL